MQSKAKALIFMMGISYSSISDAANNLCDLSIQTIQADAISYQMRDNRCEGIYYKPRGGNAAISLVSFSSWSVPEKLSNLKEIYINWRKKDGAKLTLQAESLRQYFYYRMDTIAEIDSSYFSWNLNLINDKRVGLTSKELGVLAYFEKNLGGGLRKVYVPVVMAEKIRTNPSRTADVVLVSNISLMDVWWDIEPIDDSGVRYKKLQSQHAAATNIAPDEYVHIKFDIPSKPGYYAINVTSDVDVNGPDIIPPSTRLIFYVE